MACLVTRAAPFDKDEWTKCKSGKFSKLPARWAMKSVRPLSFEGTIHEDPSCRCELQQRFCVIIRRKHHFHVE